MNVYDFDGTIYDGDSSADFLMMLAKKKPLRFLTKSFSFAKAFIAYKSGRIRKEAMKEVFFSLVTLFDDPSKLVDEFWEKNISKIKKFYYEQKKPDDVIISASPEFLIRPVADKFGFYLMGSPIDIHTGKYNGVNCHGAEKIRRLEEIFGKDVKVEEFYSDSIVDLPLAEYAEKAFMVTGDVITDWKF